MYGLRGRDGYTLLELMTVVAVIGFMSVMAIGALKGYARREDTRRAARTVAGVLESARSEAVSSGRMTWVVFEEPVNGVAPWQEPDQFAAVIWDSDNDLQPTAADRVTPIFLPPGPRQHTKRWTPGSPYSGAVLPDLDQSNDVTGGTLANTVEGTTFNVDATLGVPAVGFNSQGFPVAVSKPLQPSTGSGAIYMTDDDSSVVVVTILPIGDVRTLAYDTASGMWR
jgi:prepilin-type N-terminal cleavage/methylation domain-containing protein